MTAIPNESVLPTLSVGALIQVQYAFDSSYLMTAAQIPGSAVGALRMQPYVEGADVMFTITEYD